MRAAVTGHVPGPCPGRARGPVPGPCRASPARARPVPGARAECRARAGPRGPCPARARGPVPSAVPRAGPVPGHVPGAHLPCRNPRARRPRPPSRGRTVVQGPVGCPPTSGGPGGKWELRRQSSLRGPNHSMSIKLRELIRAVRACNTITKATWTPHYIALRQNRPRRTCRNSERMRLDSYSIQRKCNACASSKRGEIALHPHAWCVLIIMHAHITVSRLPQSLWSDGMPEAYSFTKLS